MPYFLSKLTPPRKTYPVDMTAAEREAMLAHQDYWLPFINEGGVIAMGPVADPEGRWDVAILNAPSRERAEAWQAKDPVILAGLGFQYETFSMPAIRVSPAEPLAPVSSVTP